MMFMHVDAWMYVASEKNERHFLPDVFIFFCSSYIYTEILVVHFSWEVHHPN